MKRYFASVSGFRHTGILVAEGMGTQGRARYLWCMNVASALSCRPLAEGGRLTTSDEVALQSSGRYLEIPEERLAEVCEVAGDVAYLNLPLDRNPRICQILGRPMPVGIPRPAYTKTNHKIGAPKGKLP